MNKKIYLNITSELHNRGGRNSWSRDSYHTDWYFNGFTTQKNYTHYHYIVKDFDPTKLLFAVYVVYSTGDSFGWDINGKLELIYVGHDEELANKIKKFIKEDYKDKNDKFHVKNIDGVEFFTYPWKGYFETLSYVNVESDLVK